MGRSPAGQGLPSCPVSRCLINSSIFLCSPRVSSASSENDRSFDLRIFRASWNVETISSRSCSSSEHCGLVAIAHKFYIGTLASQWYVRTALRGEDVAKGCSGDPVLSGKVPLRGRAVYGTLAILFSTSSISAELSRPSFALPKARSRWPACAKSPCRPFRPCRNKGCRAFLGASRSSLQLSRISFANLFSLALSTSCKLD